MMECYRFVVSGRVQGVFFRQAAANQARAQGLEGWICNRDDGCVEGVARGAPQALAALRAFLEKGPAAAQVDHVQWTSDAGEPALGPGFVIVERQP